MASKTEDEGKTDVFAKRVVWGTIPVKIRMTVLDGFACLDGMGQHLDWLKRTFLRCLAASLAKGPTDMIDMMYVCT